MATIAQGVLAGQLAANLTQLQLFIVALQKAVAAGATVNQISLNANIGGGLISLNAPLSVTDSAVLMNNLISLSGGLTTEWTNQLAAL